MIEQPPKFTIEEFLANRKDIFGNIPFDLIKSINEEYLYWDKVKYKSKEFNPKDVWSAVKFTRYAQHKALQFNRYLFRYTLTDSIQQSLHLFDMHIGGNLSSNIGIAETDKEKFLVSSIMEEAIASSQMEGAVTTRKKAREMIQKELKPRNISDYMIINNYHTIKHIVQHKNNILTPEELLHIHSLITKNTLERKEEEGAFRRNNDIYVVNYSTSEVVHNPPEYSEIPELVSSLCDFFNKDTTSFIHPILKGIIIHFLIAWIHPFTDGNGRTARALFYWYLLKQGYWLTEYLSISRIIKETKNQYEKSYLYTEHDDNDLTYFIVYNLKTMERAYNALKEYIKHKQKEVNLSAKFLKIPNINERQAQILKLIADDGDRVLNVKEIENRFMISNFTARSDLKGLVDNGFLSAIQVNKKKQNFIKSPDFDTLVHKYK